MPGEGRRARALVRLLAWAMLGGWARRTAAAPPEPAAIAAVLAGYDRAAVFPLPRLSPEDHAALARGELVRVLDQPQAQADAPRRATGLLVVPAARDLVWVACQDPHFAQSDSARELRVRSEGADRSVWYGLLDLPRPFSDRHWLVDVQNNHALAAQSRNQAWEHLWRLRGGGEAEVAALVASGRLSSVSSTLVAEAVWTPVNHGAWLVVALDDQHTILGYHATSVVGGAIPETLVIRFIHSSLGSVLGGVAARAQTMAAHYRDGHPPVIGGDGREVARFTTGTALDGR